MFFKWFPVRVTINDNQIFVLKNKQSINTTIPTDIVKLQINNGYHFIKTTHLQFANDGIIGLRIETYLDDFRIFTLVLITLLFFGFAITSHNLFFQILANLPMLGVLGYTLCYKQKVLLLNNLKNPKLNIASYDKFNYV